MFVCFLFFFESGNILCVNTTLERHHVTEDFVLERLEQLERRPMHESCRNSFTLYVFKGHLSGRQLSSQVVKEHCAQVQAQKAIFLQPPQKLRRLVQQGTLRICV